MPKRSVTLRRNTHLDFAGPLDVLARLPQVRLHVLASALEPVISDSRIPIMPTMRMDDAPRLDLLFIGGGHGINPLMEDAHMLAFFARRAPDATWVTSVCTGALVLGAAGLLRGYKAATHWSAMDLLPAFGAEAVYERVVVDRNRVTGGGVTAGIDFGLRLLALMGGEQLAQQVELGMEYDPRPTGCGNPRTAPPELVASVRAMMRPVYQDRLARASRIAARNGVPFTVADQ